MGASPASVGASRVQGRVRSRVQWRVQQLALHCGPNRTHRARPPGLRDSQTTVRWLTARGCTCVWGGSQTASQEHEGSGTDTVFDQSAVPCRVTAYVVAGLRSERLECTPCNDWTAVTLGDIVEATSRVLAGFSCGLSADHTDQYTFVWGADKRHSFTVTSESLSDPFLLHSDGTVRCGALLQGHSGGQITEASDSFEVMVLVRSCPADTTRGGAASPGEPPPLVCGLARVGQHSWQRLEAPHWFDDELCNAFLARVNEATTTSAVYCVPTFFGDTLVMGSMQPGRLAAVFFSDCRDDPRFWDRSSTVLLPIHANRDHWALMRLCRRDDTIYLTSYDSLQCRNSRAVHTFAAQLQGFLRHLGWQGGVQYVAEENCPQQANGYDCGPFMLLMVCLLATGQAFEGQFDNMPNVRQRIGLAIREGLAAAGFTP